MERVRGKLHSRTGASMLIALLFFLVAMTVGAVVLTAASANAGRVKRNQQEQQKYLAVASAAELVKEDIVGAEKAIFTAAYKKTIEETYYPAEYDADGNKIRDSYIIVSGPKYDFEEPFTLTNSQLLGELTDVLGAIYCATVPSETGLQEPWVLSTNVSKTLDFTATAMPEVTGSLAAIPPGYGQFGLKAILKIKTDQEDAVPENLMAIEFAPDLSREIKADAPDIDGNKTTYVTHYITTIEWNLTAIRKEAQG